MKRLIALICALLMFVMVLMPATSVSAARETNVWGNQAVNGELVLENGEAWSVKTTFPEDFTFKFTMKLDEVSTSSSPSMQIRCGTVRYGLYIRPERISVFGGSVVYCDIGTNWHDWRLEIKDKVMKVYIDNQLVTTQPGQVNGSAASVAFNSADGSKLRLADYSIQSYDGIEVKAVSASWNGEYIPPMDVYTPGFTTDWKGDLGHWYITDSPVVQVDKEVGTLTLNNEYGVKGGYYCAQYPVNCTENFDWEWKMKIPSNVNSQMQFKFLGGGINSYFYIEKHNKITGAEQAEDGKQTQFGIPIFLGDNWGEWCDMKFERRGDYYTIYVNGGKVRTIRAYASSAYPGILSYNITGVAPGTGYDVMVIGEVKYTPYFDKVDMVKPYNRSEYAEGTDIVLCAKPQDGNAPEYINYYVDGIMVGKGYAPDYEYVLKNARVGTYQVSAGIGGERSVANTMLVKPAFDAELVLANDEIKNGESVKVSLDVVALNVDLEPNHVEYYLNNRLAATCESKPFAMEITPEEIGTSAIYAKVSNGAGTVLTTDVKTVNVVGGNEHSTNFNREYEVRYDYNSGNGVLDIKDGYFGLSMKHDGKNVTYMSRDGEETYVLNKVKETVTGTGDYRIVVTAGYAEVYYNGQYVFSFFMPNDNGAKKIEKSGIENFVIDGRGNKVTYFEKKWDGAADYMSETLPAVVNYSVEFDKTDLSDETFIFYDGRYRVQLEFRDGKVTAHDQGKVASDIKEQFPLNDNSAETGYYRLTVSESTAQLWCNNKLIGGFVAPLYAHKPQIIRQMSNPSSSTFVAVKGTDDTYYFAEDFKGNKELIAADYWVTGAQSNFKKSIDNVGDEYFRTLDGSGMYWLNAITRNVDFKSRVKVDSADNFYFLTRLFETYYDMKIGYDFRGKCWYAEFEGRRDIVAGQKAKVTNSGEFELGVWHDMELIVEDNLVTLIVDGEAVLHKVDLPYEYSGFTGFGFENAKFSFTNVEYEGRGKVTPGMKSYVDNTGMSYCDFLYIDGGKTVVASTAESGVTYSYDNGSTWTSPMTEKNGRVFSGNVVNMPDGRLVKLTSRELKFYASESLDDGRTWREIALVTERATGYRVMINDGLYLTKSGKLICCTDEGGSETSCQSGIFYSDDGGYTWKESETYFAEAETGINLSELSVVDLPQENAYRVIGRSDRGFLYQADSYDGCKTFGELKPSPLPVSTCTAKIRRDVSEEKTYYAIWCYDTTACWQARYGIPRNRYALAVSYDGMKTWEFVQTLFEIDDYPIGLVLNASMDVMGDTIYIKIPGKGSGTSCMGALMALDKTKIKSTKRFEELHQRIFFGTTADMEAESISVLTKESGEAFVLGNYESISVENGNMYKADSICKVFSAHLAISGNTATVTIGDAAVVFTEGSASYVVNGENVDFGAVCMKDGHINIEAMAKAFGKCVTKCEKGWVVWSDAVSSPYYREQIENLI